MKIRVAKVEGQNESLPIVVNDIGMPIDRLNFFIMEELRGLADSTVEKRAWILIFVEQWANLNGISLLQEMREKCLADDGKFNSLISYLRKKHSTKNSGNVLDFKPDNVVPDYFNERLRFCEAYFEYLNNKYLSQVRLNDPKVSQNKIFFDRLIKRLKAKLIAGKSSSDKTGLSFIQQDSLQRGLHDCRYFGWNKRTYLRNKLITLLIYETGIRKGELLSLTIGDCCTKVEKPYIVVKQNIQFDDPRTKIPQVKTEERVIPISEQLAQLINDYKKVRNEPKEAKKQPPFLLLSTHAPYSPLSESGVNGVFESIKNSTVSFQKFTPHILRHTRFENLERYFDRKGYDEAKRTKLKNTLGGWSRNSQTSKNYEKLATQEQAYDVLKGMFDEIDGEFY